MAIDGGLCDLPCIHAAIELSKSVNTSASRGFNTSKGKALKYTSVCTGLCVLLLEMYPNYIWLAPLYDHECLLWAKLEHYEYRWRPGFDIRCAAGGLS
jgi:hypothetical protein